MAIEDLRGAIRIRDLASRLTTAYPPVTIATDGLALAAVVLAAVGGAGLSVSSDGALHTNLARQIAETGSLNTTVASHYPALYHVIGAIGYLIAGPSGVQAISFVAFGFISAFTFLFVRELTGSAKSGLAAQVLVTLSPVLLFYSSLTLIEPMLVAAIMASLFFTLKASKEPSHRNLILAAASLSIIILTKQTGLPVVAAGILFLAGTRCGPKRAGFVALFVIAIAVGPYMFMFWRTGTFTDPGQQPVAQLVKESSELPGSILIGGLPDRIEPWSVELDAEGNWNGVYERGTVLHNARHVYIANMFNWQRFTGLHSLYPTEFNGAEIAVFLLFHWIVDASLIAGILTALYLARTQPQWQLVLLTLAASYAAMTWGTDTRRLFVYVPVVSSALVVLPYVYWWPRAKPYVLKKLEGHERDIMFGVPALAAVAVFAAIWSVVPLEVGQFRALDRRDATQGGGFTSVGGVASIKATGAWLKDHLAEDEAFTAASVYEWEYYSERQDLWDDGLDYRTYFLSPNRLDYFLKKAGARYVVIRRNQVLDDAAWNHIELAPRSFVNTLEARYRVAYTSPFGDIRVFDVNSPPASASGS